MISTGRGSKKELLSYFCTKYNWSWFLYSIVGDFSCHGTKVLGGTSYRKSLFYILTGIHNSAGCSKNVIDDISIENGRWHCPLHDDDAELVGPGLQCYAMCNEFYELHDGDGGHYSMNKFSKICKCSEENNRCHWARLDNVPVCKATKLNRIINGQTAEKNSKPYMVSVAVKQKVQDGKGKKESSFFSPCQNHCNMWGVIQSDSVKQKSKHLFTPDFTHRICAEHVEKLC